MTINQGYPVNERTLQPAEHGDLATEAVGLGRQVADRPKGAYVLATNAKDVGPSYHAALQV